jgi:hypothetical protein
MVLVPPLFQAEVMELPGAKMSRPEGAGISRQGKSARAHRTRERHANKINGPTNAAVPCRPALTCAPVGVAGARVAAGRGSDGNGGRRARRRVGTRVKGVIPSCYRKRDARCDGVGDGVVHGARVASAERHVGDTLL